MGRTHDVRLAVSWGEGSECATAWRLEKVYPAAPRRAIMGSGVDYNAAEARRCVPDRPFRDVHRLVVRSRDKDETHRPMLGTIMGRVSHS